MAGDELARPGPHYKVQVVYSRGHFLDYIHQAPLDVRIRTEGNKVGGRPRGSGLRGGGVGDLCGVRPCGPPRKSRAARAI